MKLCSWKGVTTVLLSLSTTSVYGQKSFDCPPVGGINIIGTMKNDRDIQVPIITDPNTLCTIVRHLAPGKLKGKTIGRMQVNATSDGKERVPVARSYATIGTWEVSAGLLSTESSVDSCSTSSCTISLPASETDEVYM